MITSFPIHLLTRSASGGLDALCPMVGTASEDADMARILLHDGDGSSTEAAQGYLLGLRNARSSISPAGDGRGTIRLLRIPQGERMSGDWWWVTDSLGEFFMRTDATEGEHPLAEHGVTFVSDLQKADPQQEEDARLLALVETEELAARRGLDDGRGGADA